MRTEREPNRYEPLNETHRRVAEAEEKHRSAEQDQARSASAQTEPEPDRPGPELSPHRPEAAPERDPDSPEARLAAKEQELQEQVQLGRIKPGEMIYQLRRFDNELRIQIERAGMPPLRDGSAAEFEKVRSPEHPDDIRDQPTGQSRHDPNQRMPEARIEREAEAAEYEIVGRGEVSDARAARLERLRGIDRDIERESESKGPDFDHDSGDHSR